MPCDDIDGEVVSSRMLKNDDASIPRTPANDARATTARGADTTEATGARVMATIMTRRCEILSLINLCAGKIVRPGGVSYPGIRAYPAGTERTSVEGLPDHPTSTGEVLH